MAQLLLQQGRVTEALKYFERAATLSRTEGEIVNALSYAEATRTQLEVSIYSLPTLSSSPSCPYDDEFKSHPHDLKAFGLYVNILLIPEFLLTLPSLKSPTHRQNTQNTDCGVLENYRSRRSIHNWQTGFKEWRVWPGKPVDEGVC